MNHEDEIQREQYPLLTKRQSVAVKSFFSTGIGHFIIFIIIAAIVALVGLALYKFNDWLLADVIVLNRTRTEYAADIMILTSGEVLVLSLMLIIIFKNLRVDRFPLLVGSSLLIFAAMCALRLCMLFLKTGWIFPIPNETDIGFQAIIMVLVLISCVSALVLIVSKAREVVKKTRDEIQQDLDKYDVELATVQGG